MSSKSQAKHALTLFDPAILSPAAMDAFKKLAPHHLAANPVIFVTEVVAALVTFLWARSLFIGGGEPLFSGQIALWLWFTVLFATFAEAVAEGRGKAQAATLRATRSDTIAKRLMDPDGEAHLAAVVQTVPALDLKVGDVVLVEAGDIDPLRRRHHRGRRLGQRKRHHRRIRAGDSRGRRRPLRRHRRHHRPVGLDQGAHHRRARLDLHRPDDRAGRRRRAPEDPNELALSVLLAGLTLIFLIAVVTLWGFAVLFRRDGVA